MTGVQTCALPILYTSYRQGKEEGRSEGLAEGEAKISLMFKNMKEMGMDIASIARIAKYSEEEVRKILE